MNPDLLKALEKSISYWQDIVNGDDIPRGHAGCMLCQYCFVIIEKDCDICPVNNATRSHLGSCAETPYVDLMLYIDTIGEGRSLSTKQIIERMTAEQKEHYIELCQKELDFLRSLLP